jgi:dCTP deaminase
MILTGPQIKWAKKKGYLDISNWDEIRLNPNSYNLRLADELMIYGHTWDPDKPVTKDTIIHPVMLDMKQDLPTVTIKIPEEGIVLKPGVLYLGRTMEYTETHTFVPMLEGRSSVGRLGISIHSTAGFGDIGFCGYWTLEISCVQPVRIYSGVDICQIYYHTVGRSFGEDGDYFGNIFIPYDINLMKYDNKGKYQKNTGIQKSMIYKEFEK